MLLIVLIIIIFLYAYISTIQVKSNPTVIDEMKMNIYPYSGLNEEIYLKYINDLNLFSNNIKYTDIASKYLYSSIDRAYDLQFFTNHDFTDKIIENAIKGEEILLQSSLRYGNMFNPKYLNNIL